MAEHVKLTALAVEKAKPDSKRREIPDGGSGVYLIVQGNGSKSWAFRYRYGGKPRKLTLGTVATGTAANPPVLGGALSLSGARALAKIARGDVARGVDPGVEWRAQKDQRKTAAVEAIAPRDDSVEAIANRFLAEYAVNLRPATREQYSRVLRKTVLPAWGAKPIDSITPGDVKALVAAVKADGRPVMANRVFGVVSSFFGWIGEQDDIATVSSPCVGVRPRRRRGSDASPAAGLFIREQARARALTDEEVRLVWGAADRIGWPFGPFVKLLLLTAARRTEVAGMAWDEVNVAAKLWTLPAARSKNGVEHAIPLSDQAVKILQSLPRVGDRFVLSTNGRNAISGFGRAKQRIDAAITEPLPAWTLHDLRRTVASGLGALGVSGETIERLLNHRSGVFGGLRGVYQRHRYEAEIRDALQRWANHVEALCLLG